MKQKKTKNESIDYPDLDFEIGDWSKSLRTQDLVYEMLMVEMIETRKFLKQEIDFDYMSLWLYDQWEY